MNNELGSKWQEKITVQFNTPPQYPPEGTEENQYGQDSWYPS